MERWLSGTVPHPDPIVRAVLHSFEQVRQDLARWTADLPAETVWETPAGLPSLGFQLRHMAGSVDRLLTYAAGESLTPAQLAYQQAESTPGAGLAELLQRLHETLAGAAQRLSTPADYSAPRAVGRQRLPTTLGGLLVHVAEHTQRHLGQAILTCKLLKTLDR